MDNKDSLFNDIPDTAMPHQAPHSVVGPDSQAIVQEENFVYSIMSGVDENEYYTFELPIIEGSSIVINNPIKKGSVHENILNEVVEECYMDNLVVPHLDFDMSSGVLIKKYHTDQILWLGRTREEAANTIKDKVINKYQQIVPNLINKISNIEAKMKQPSNVRRQNNDDLIQL